MKIGSVGHFLAYLERHSDGRYVIGEPLKGRRIVDATELARAKLPEDEVAPRDQPGSQRVFKAAYASIFIEPGKILFLNNAINHGVLGPLGVAQVQNAGRSIYFLLETNPGPGLGILLAYFVFSKGAVKDSTPGSILIHFFGGIHETIQ